MMSNKPHLHPHQEERHASRITRLFVAILILAIFALLIALEVTGHVIFRGRLVLLHGPLAADAWPPGVSNNSGIALRLVKTAVRYWAVRAECCPARGAKPDPDRRLVGPDACRTVSWSSW
jgi:hypothetical protein